MTNFVINSEMKDHVDYGIPEIQSYRSVTHDIIRIYGFRFKNVDAGKIKATMAIEEGLRKRFSFRI